MIELRNVSVFYGTCPALRDISLTFPPGQVTALVGPNGCGKSTLLRTAVRLLSPASGCVLLDGLDAKTYSSKEYARQAALLPQNRPAPDMTVETLVLHGRFPWLGYPRRYAPKDRHIARRAMERTGVAELADENLTRLSGGQRQKVYLAMAIAQDTPSLFLDEPTTFLDIANQLELVELARELAAEGKAVVTVLHDLNLALCYGDRVAVLDGGVLAALDTPERIYQSGVLERIFHVRIRRVELEDSAAQYCFEWADGHTRTPRG